MEPLSAFPLPLSMNGPPVGYGWEERDTLSLASKTTAFESEIDRRDKFLGERRCVICGSSRWPALERCLIIRDAEHEVELVSQVENEFDPARC